MMECTCGHCGMNNKLEKNQMKNKMPDVIYARKEFQDIDAYDFDASDSLFRYTKYIRADLVKPSDDVLDIVTQILNEARCLSKEVVGNRELALRIVTALRNSQSVPQEVVEKLAQGWYLIPPEPTSEMIRAYMFERAKGQYPHEDAGGSVARKLKALFTGKKQSNEERTYQQAIDALLNKGE